MNEATLRRRGAAIRAEARRAREHPRRVLWARALAVALLVVGALDAASTELALQTGGAMEFNPLIRAAQEHLGVWWIGAKMAAHALLAAALLWYPNRPTIIALGIVTLFTALIAVNNLLIYRDIIG